MEACTQGIGREVMRTVRESIPGLMDLSTQENLCKAGFMVSE